MAAPLHPSLGITVGLVAFIAWRLASRMRRIMGRQRLSRWRPWFSVVFFPLLALLLLLASLVRPEAALALAGGCGIGVALAFWSLRLTRFEATAQGLFYTPNSYLGIALSILLIARLGWRYLQVFGAEAPFAASPDTWGRSPLTLLIFGMLAGYYATYAAGLLRWKRQAETGSPAH